MVDHKTPLGPSPSPERIAELDALSNKQAAHNKCNRDKWDKVDEPEPAQWATHRCWW